jgi:uncharacterized protein
MNERHAMARSSAVEGRSCGVQGLTLYDHDFVCLRNMLIHEKKIQRISAAKIARLLDLNNGHAQETSWLSESQFRHLLREACYARVVAASEAMILAFDPQAEYDSPNFKWFRERFSNFVYIDRVHVDERSRRRGLATALYQDLFRWAESSHYDFIACEVNQIPPNPASDSFHERMDFAQVGEGEPYAGKRVRYLLRPIQSARSVLPKGSDTAKS